MNGQLANMRSPLCQAKTKMGEAGGLVCFCFKPDFIFADFRFWKIDECQVSILGYFGFCFGFWGISCRIDVCTHSFSILDIFSATHSLTRPLTRSSTHSLTELLDQLTTHPLTYPIYPSLTHQPTHLLTHEPTHPVTQSSLTQSLTQSPPHSPIHTHLSTH